jgi:hypothetical protein
MATAWNMFGRNGIGVMAEHTPGPWVVFKSRLSGMFVIGKPADERTDAQGDGLAMADREEDASLIAAAPDLLEALKVMLEHSYCHFGRAIPELSHAGKWQLKARRAIQEAEGQASETGGSAENEILGCGGLK